MIGHYLTSALAKFRKAPFTTGANVLTLALGLACFIGAWGVASWWTSADHYHPGADRIFVVGQTNQIGQNSPAQEGRGLPNFAISSWNLAGYLRADFPELERVARLAAQGDTPVSADDQKTILKIATAEPELLDIFAFDFIEGDAAALRQPNSAVLTADAAARLFGAAPALGKPILVNGREALTVTAVIAPVRQPSFMGSRTDSTFRFDMLRDWASTPMGQQLDQLPSWIGVNPYTFVRLPESMTVAAFNARLPEFLERRVPAADRDVAKISMQAFPVSRLSTFSLDDTLRSGGAGLTAIAALLGLAAITLAIACVNYANLATAQAAAHARQAGLRRTLGAQRRQVMLQSWLEAGVLTLAALVVALILAAIAAPAVRAAAALDILFFFSRGFAPFAVLAALVVGVTLIAGAYPAFALSRVRPIEALRGGAGGRAGPRAIARILVCIQFASASFLLIMVAVTQLQRHYIERAALAPHQDQIVFLNDLMPLDVDYDTLADRLAEQPGVRSVSVVDHMPWTDSFNGMFLARSQDSSAATQPAFVRSVGYDYFETLELPLLAGRVFDRRRDTLPAPLFIPSQQPIPAVIDRRYAEALGFETPEAAIGELIHMPAAMAGGTAQPVEIVGVTETERTRLETDAAPGSIYTFGPRALWGQQLPVLRVAREDVPGALRRIEAVWDDLAPSIPLDPRFFDALFEQNFRTYARVSQLFMLLSASAFIIASVGLVGIAVHVTARRRREIGVRKTLGATTARVLRMLIADFSRPVVAGNLLAWPFAWFAAQAYLQAFAERAPLTPLPFILSLLITLLIAWLSVGGQAWKAARVKPALVLKAE